MYQKMDRDLFQQNQDRRQLHQQSFHSGDRTHRELRDVRVLHLQQITTRVSEITGKVCFMMYRDAMKFELLIKFITRLMKDAGSGVFLILQNLRIHYGKEVRRWFEEYREQIKASNLPFCSSAQNPDEYLNGDFKTRVHSDTPVCNRGALANKTSSFLYGNF